MKIKSLLIKSISVFTCFSLCAALLCIIMYLTQTLLDSQTESTAHYTPEYEKIDLTPFLQKEELTETDYNILFYQTGLAPVSIQEILSSTTDPIKELIQYQTNFFRKIQVACTPNSIITKEEYAVNKEGRPLIVSSIAPFHKGDILITLASHSYGWRNGHGAIIVDADNRKTLEAVVLGENSSLQNADKWTKFPNFALLRLKSSEFEEGDSIANTAITYLNEIPYDFTVGILSPKAKIPSEIRGTQCAHLIWQTYYLHGVDIDSDGGLIVTPYDILKSDKLEVVQIYGMNPEEYMTFSY